MESDVATPTGRQTSYGQSVPPSWVDRFGVWLSLRRVRRVIGDAAGKRIADLGCGFEARIGRELMAGGAHMMLVDIAVAEDLRSAANADVLEGALPTVLAGVESGSVDAGRKPAGEGSSGLVCGDRRPGFAGFWFEPA